VTEYDSAAVRNRTGSIRTALFAGLFAVPYVALLFWFHDVDVYHKHFSATGLLIFAYNACRLVFCFYLFWIVEAAGSSLLRLTASKEFAETAHFERIVLSFFTGAGIWHVGMIILGYLSLYTLPAAIIITLPLVCAAYRDAQASLFAISRAANTALVRHAKNGTKATLWFVFGLFAVACTALILVKGLYPGGNHDYFTQYFYYFEAVIAHHGLWPNEVWDQYFYDKGAGLTFLSMLLTDPLAPQLSTLVLMSGATFVVFLACNSAAPNTGWPYIATLLFIIVYIYTPNWAEFEKTHELTTALAFACFWASSNTLARCGNPTNRIWPICAVVTLIGAMIATPSSITIFGPTFGTLFIWYLAKGHFSRARFAFALATISVVMLLATFAVNYATTGILSDLLVTLTWQISDIEKLYRLGTLPMTLELIWILAPYHQFSEPLSGILKIIDQTLRFDIFYPLAGIAIAVGIVGLSIRYRDGRWSAALRVPHLIAVLFAAIAAFVLVGATLGRLISASFYRFGSIAVPVMLTASVCLLGLPIAGADARFVRIVNHPRSPGVVFALCLVTLIIASHPYRLPIILSHSAQFAIGAISIDTAYTLQPFKYPLAENAIYPGARGAYSVVGPNVPIWSLHHDAYCMLPGCRMESFREFVVPRWQEVMLGTPEQAREALQASNHNYFLFARDLPIYDPFPLSPLFSPDNIAGFLGIRWTDGNTALLTWLAPGVEPLDAQWIAAYRRSVSQSDLIRLYPYQELKGIFARLSTTPHPWKPFALPWIKPLGLLPALAQEARTETIRRPRLRFFQRIRRD
jgi:hypothetical protein